MKTNALHKQLQLAAPKHLKPDYWLQNASDNPTARLSQITRFNAKVYNRLDFPNVFAAGYADFEASLANTTIPSRPLFDVNGDVTNFTALNEQLVQITRFAKLRYALVLHRSNLRTFPNKDLVTDDPFAYKTDWHQESTIDLGTAVVCGAQVGAWYFCLTPLYWGWLHADDLAFCDKNTAQDYATSRPRILTLASRGYFAVAPDQRLLTQMGTTLPLIRSDAKGHWVKVPLSKADGTLLITSALIPAETEDFSIFPLPAQKSTLIQQAFLMLGEPYSWGGSCMGIFGRDCSRFLKDAYATLGFILPRNGNQQEQVCEPVLDLRAIPDTAKRKAAIIAEGEMGDILAMPGHVLLYLGHDKGEPYVLHSTGGQIMQVVVSTLNIGTPPLIDRLHSLGRVF